MKTVARMASSVQSLTALARFDSALGSLVRRTLAGITASGSVVLSDIIRSQVDEGDKKKFRSQEQQLSQQLRDNEELDRLPAAYLEHTAKLAADLPFVTLDGSDVSKPHSRKLEFLDVVRNGSAKPRKRVVVGPAGIQPLFGPGVDSTANETEATVRKDPHPANKAVARKVRKQQRQEKQSRARPQARKDARRQEKAKRVKYPDAPALKTLGYWLIMIEAGDGKGNHLPLSIDVFSTMAPAYQALGEDAWAQTFRKAVTSVLNSAGKTAIWLMDRGFDDISWMNFMHEEVRQYAIRLKKGRMVRPGTEEADSVSVGKLIESLDYRHTVSLRRVDKNTHEEKYHDVPLAWIPVRIDGVDHPQYLVVAKTGKKTRLIVVTDVRPENAEEAGKLIQAYLERWGSEEATRALKQLTNLENFRVRKLVAIRRLLNMALIAVGIQATMLLDAGRLARAVLDRCTEFIAEVRYKIYRVWRVVQNDISKAFARRSPELLT